MNHEDDPDEQAARRRRAITLAIEAMVAARHAQIMDSIGLPRDSFEPQSVEVLDPEPDARRPGRRAGALGRGTGGAAEDSVLRGKQRRVTGR